jgi:hypothetical protein
MKTGYTTSQNGNILFAILIAIALMGALTIVMSDGFSGAKGISDTEMDAKVNKILAYSQSVKEAVELVYAKDGVTETDFLFAHPKNHTDFGDNLAVSPTLQIFGAEGGGAQFLWPIPEGINDGTPWEITGRTLAPNVGVNLNQDLLLYLPNVTEKFCRAVNKTLGYTENDIIPLDQTGCGFSGTLKWANTYGTTFNNFSNDFAADGFKSLPAYYMCVQCEADSNYYYYYTLLAR